MALADLGISLSNILFALIITLFGFIVGKIAGKISLKLLSEIELNKILKKNALIQTDIEILVSIVVSYIIYTITLIAAISTLGITNILLHIGMIIIVILTVSTILVVTSLFLPNFFAGIYLNYRKLLKDEIMLDNLRGKILRKTITSAYILTNNTDTIKVPYFFIFKNLDRLKK
jgi:hypothetical protein